MIILHISDIHIKTGDEDILNQSEAIASCTYEYLPYIQYVFIVISGDISFSGQTDQFEYAAMFLGDIKNKIIEENNDVKVEFIITPGNHDCDFTEDSETRKIVIDSITKSTELSEDIINTCSLIQNNYFSFIKTLTGKELSGKEKLTYTSSFNINKYQINFIIMNSALLSKKNEEYGKLVGYYPSENDNNNNNSENINIFVLHHPLHWFQNYREIRSQIKSNIVISAHEHQNNYGTIQDTEHDHIHFIESGALSSQEKLENSYFNIIYVNLNNIEKTTYYEYKYVNNSYMQSSRKQIPLILTQSTQFSITNDFQQILQEPGATYKHNLNHRLVLNDFFIYPELEELFTKNNDIYTISSEELKTIEPGVIALIGDEKIGKTSLLHMLFMSYLNKGFIPLLLNGYFFGNKTESIRNIVLNAIKEQYGKDYIEKYNQSSKHKKILLIDNFNKSKVRNYNSIVAELSKLADYVIITLESTFETNLLNHDITKYYKIKPFGHHLRRTLIEKWISLNKDIDIDDDNIVYQCDEIAKLLNQAISMTIPSVPFYLIILIQSIFTGDNRQLLDSGLKPYYDYLIAESLQENGLAAHELLGIKHYLQLFAGKLFDLESEYMSETELIKFNDDYAKEYYTVDFNKRMDLLLKAKIFVRQNDEYKFYYKYLHYYFITEYFTEHLEEQNIKDYICHCCKHLYVKDYANTILFLTNVKYDSFILEQLMNSLSNVFKEVTPIEYKEDTKDLQCLFKDAPKQIFINDDTASPSENRHLSNKELDKSDIELYYEKPKNDDELSELENMLIIITNMNIISRILKTNYETIKIDQKIKILHEYYNAPLRAIKVHYKNLVEFKDDIIESIEQKFSNTAYKKEKLINLIVEYLRFLTDITSFLYLLHAANGLSQHLNDQINVIAKTSPAHELISFLHELRSPGDIKIGKLKEIVNKFQKEPIALRIIRMGVIQRLHMFTSTSAERQKISQIKALHISIQAQRVIEYKSYKHKA